jgi:transposase
VSVKKWVVVLSADECAKVQVVLSQPGKAGPRVRARILLLASGGLTDEVIAAEVHADRSTVERTRRRFVQAGLAAALTDRPRPGAKPVLDERGGERLADLAGSSPPAGRQWWTMQLLADALVAQGVRATISDETVRRALHRMGLLAARKRARHWPRHRGPAAGGRPT